MTDETEESELHSGLGLSTYHEMAKANAGASHVTGVGAAPVLPTNAWNADPVPQEPPFGLCVDWLPNMLSVDGSWPQAEAEKMGAPHRIVRYEAQAQPQEVEENPPDNTGMTYDPTLDPRRPEYIKPEPQPRPAQLKRRF